MSYILDDARGSVLKIKELQREISIPDDLIAFFKLFSILIREKPSIVHTHMAKAGAIGRAAAWVYGTLFNKKIKLVHTYHGHVLEGYFGPFKSAVFLKIERILARCSDAVIALSASQKMELTDKYKVACAAKVHMIPLGFNLSPFKHSSQNKGIFRSAHGLDTDVTLIGIVGRLVPIKNHRMFLDAAKILLTVEKSRKLKFIIIGDGELNSELIEYAKKSNIYNEVCFLGWQRELPAIYADLDIVALTSNNEGTPVSIIEAMAAGVPVISTCVGGVKDLMGSIKDRIQSGNGSLCVHERGVVCDKNDANGLACGLHFLLTESPDSSLRRIENARQHVYQNYSDQILIQRIGSLYCSLMEK